MTEFSGYCPKCNHHEDVFANKPCPKCGTKMILTHMDGMTEAEINGEWEDEINGEWEDEINGEWEDE